MRAHDRLDQLAATIRRKNAVDSDSSAARFEAAQIIRSCIPGEAERSTALHEAGHAVAMEVTGLRC
jgi:hypothetical protein